MQRTLQSFLAAAAVAFGLSTSPVFADETATPQRAEVSEAQLQKYAGASQKVAMVVNEYRPKVQAASDDSARNALMKEADEKMVSAVEKDGLSVDEFNNISAAVQQDPALQEKLAGMMETKQ